jgi:cytochrome bd-type quinol oxidase subunit 2
MRRVLGLLSPIAAALSGAFAVGVLAASIMMLSGAATDGVDLRAFLAGSLIVSVYSVVFGTLPGIVALTLTPAARHPWRSLPILVVATTIGFAIWYLAVQLGATDTSMFFGLFVLPSAAGLIAAANIDRFPKRLRFCR